MNRIYRIVRNPLTGNCAVASELARSQGNRSRTLSTIAVGIAACMAAPAMASPAWYMNDDYFVSGTGSSHPRSVHLDSWVGLGRDGTGSLTISDGGRFSNTSSMTVGFSIGTGSSNGTGKSKGSLTVTGAGSTLTTDGGLMVGEIGEGSLAITAGGTVQNGTYAYIGAYEGSAGDATVSGPGSLWKMDGAWMMIGKEGAGRLTIDDGGKVIMDNAMGLDSRIGDGSDGQMKVSGFGSEWRSNGDLTVGYAGTGQLTITDAGSVAAGGPIRVGIWGVGNVDVSNGGSLATDDVLDVGHGHAKGTLNVGTDGTVNSASGNLGRNAASDGTATVAGTGAQWSNTGKLTIGDEGRGTLNIEDGGTVSSLNAALGGSIWGIGTANISGAGSRWNNTGILDVGYLGIGTLTVADGGRLDSARTRIGHVREATGEVNIVGHESVWTNTGILSIGDNGSGLLGIRDGATVSTGALVLGNHSAGNGKLVVDGEGSLLTTGFLGMGGGDGSSLRSGAGVMYVFNGAAVHTADDAIIANVKNSRGDIAISNDAQWTIDGQLQLGVNGSASLLVAHNSYLRTGQATCIACSTNSRGVANVTGAGSSWIQADHMNIGHYGYGYLTIADGASVVVGETDTGYLLLAGNKDAHGSLNIGNGGLAGTLETSVVRGGDGTAMVNFNHIDAIDFASQLTGSLGVRTFGKGITTLSARNDYSGETSLWAGTLRAGVAGAFSATSHHAVRTGANMHLGGFNQNIASLDNAGTISFADNGSAAGTVLTVQGDYVGNSGVLHMNTALAGDDSATDRLVINGDSHGHSWLQVHNAGGAGAATRNGIQLIAVHGTSEGVFELQGRAVAGLYEYWLHQGGRDTPNDGSWYLRSEAPSVPPIDPPNPPVNPEIVDPEITGPEVVDPEVVGPEITDPEITDPEIVDPEIEAPEVVNPVVVPPEVIAPPRPTKPTAPVLRPEPAAYLGNQIAALRMFRGTLHDRVGEQNLSGRNAGAHGNSVWMRRQTSTLDAGILDGQIKMNTRADIAQFGLEKQFAVGAGKMHVGAMGGYGRATSEDRSIISNHQASGTVKGTNAGIYGTWFQQADGQPGAYLDALVQYARFDNIVKGGYLGREEYDSQAWSLSLEAGRAFQVHAGKTYGIHVEPQAQVVYTDFSSDDVREANGTLVRSQKAGSTDMRLGVRVFARALSNERNRVQPFATVNWWSGGAATTLSMDDERLSHASSNLLEAKLGAQLELGRGWSGWGQLGHQWGGDAHREVSGQLGLKLSW